MGLPPVSTRLHRFLASDGEELSYAVWHREPMQKCPTMVLVLHGIGFHSAPYRTVAENIARPGTLFAGLDLRGHGRSGGVRGEMAPLSRILQDIEEWRRDLSHLALSTEMLLIGESMTGPYAALYCAHNPGTLKGLVLVAPAVLSSWRQLLHGDTASFLFTAALRPSSAKVDLVGWRLELSSRDSGFVQQRRSDPLGLDVVGRTYVSNIAGAITRLMAGGRRSVSCPILVLHGARDQALTPFGSRLLLSRLRSPAKRLVVLPDAYHTLFWDSSSPRVFAEIEGFISNNSVAAANLT